MLPSRLRSFAVLCGILVIAPSVSARDDEDDAIKTVIDAYFKAIERNDLKSVGDCLGKSFAHPEWPTRDAFLAHMAELLSRIERVRYAATPAPIRRNADGTASVRIRYEGELQLKGQTKPLRDSGHWIITLEKQAGRWKWIAANDAFSELLGRLTAAKAPEERVALVRREDDAFLTGDFVPKLANEIDAALNSERPEIALKLLDYVEVAALAMREPKNRERTELLALQLRGGILNRQERHAEAIAIYRKVLAQHQLHRRRNQELFVLVELGECLASQGNFAEALATLEPAQRGLEELTLRASEPLRTGLVARELQLHNILGNLYREIGDYGRASLHYKLAIAMADRAEDVETFLAAQANLAALRVEQGHVDAAIQTMLELLPLVKKMNDPSKEATLSNNLGFAYAESGRPAEALRRFEEARKLMAGKSQVGEATALLNSAMISYQLGEHDDALRICDRVLKVYLALGNSTGAVRTLKLSALVHQRDGRSAEAAAAYRKVLDLLKVSGSSSELAQTTFLLGLTLELRGQPDAAASLYDDAETVLRRLDDHFRTFLVRLKRSDLLLADGSRKYDAKTLAALETEVGEAGDPRMTMGYYRVIGRKLREEGRSGESLAAYQKAIDAGEVRLAAIDDPLFKASFGSDSVSELYEATAELLASTGKPAECFATIERAKARSLSTLLERSRTPLAKSMTMAQRLEEQNLQESVAAAQRLSLSSARFVRESGKSRKELTEATNEAVAKYDRFRRQLYQIHPELPTSRGEFAAVSLGDLQTTLFAEHPHTAIVSYLVGPENALIAVLTPAREAGQPANLVVRTVPKGSKALGDAAAAFRSACRSPLAGAVISNDLWDWLIKPIEKDIAGAKHLVIVPYAPLLTIPFHALKRDDGPYLIEKYAVSYAPSVAALVAMRSQTDRRKKAPLSKDSIPLFAIGRPKFSGDLKDLPNTEREAAGLKELFAGNAEVAIGPNATRSEVLRRAESAKVLHFATHGLANDSRPLFSSLAVTPTAGDDGRLFAHDILDLNLTADLVVLSACDTARGKEFIGEGTLGLSWAFFVAGASSVVVSQWQVADDVTGTMMIDFHTRLRSQNARDKAESLREAQLRLLKEPKTQHPYYWAAFVLTGDWR